jgi:RimJ/RimL family protein N-acetyltransferase
MWLVQHERHRSRSTTAASRPIIDSTNFSNISVHSRWPKIPDADVQKTEEWMSTKTFTTPDASGAIARQFMFVIIRNDDEEERIIGTLNLNSLIPAPHLGYTVHPDFWNLGYGTEALRGFLDAWWKLPRDPSAVSQLKQSERIFAAINKVNYGSYNVLRKNGFTVYLSLPVEGAVIDFMQLQRPNAEAAS